jgi:hypothetical protein
VSLALVPNLIDRRPGRLRLIPPILFLLALTFLIVGMARPHAKIRVPRHEATVVLAIDISRSMSRHDVTADRDPRPARGQRLPDVGRLWLVDPETGGGSAWTRAAELRSRFARGAEGQTASRGCRPRSARTSLLSTSVTGSARTPTSWAAAGDVRPPGR